MRRDDPDLEHAQPERDLVEDDDTDMSEADEAEADHTPTPGGRPRLLVLIGSALLLLVIGAGIAMFFAPGRGTPPAAVAPSAAPNAAGTTSAADLPTSSVPTALPLPEAIGDVSSTEPVAQVGDATITRGEFVRAYQPGTPPSQVLKQLIQVELLIQQAAVEGVTIDQTKVDAEIAQIKQQNSLSDDAAFKDFLQKNNISSEAELRTLIGRSQVVDQMLLTHTTMEQAHARHILLSATADKQAARKAEAEDLLKQLQNGADFATLASEKSEDPGSKDKGGDLGWAPRGLFVAEFDDAVFSMKKDELRLVQSQFGWHIIQLIDPPEVRSIESRAMLNTPPGQQAINDTFLPWIEKLQSAAEAAQKIKILVTDDQLVTSAGA
jgi:peptidyl-prolyl cis-trans isomerase C